MCIVLTCSKGTYVRSLVESIGEKLGCGGTVSALHRVWSASFKNSPMYSLQDLKDSECLECCTSISLALKKPASL